MANEKPPDSPPMEENKNLEKESEIIHSSSFEHSNEPEELAAKGRLAELRQEIVQAQESDRDVREETKEEYKNLLNTRIDEYGNDLGELKKEADQAEHDGNEAEYNRIMTEVYDKEAKQFDAKKESKIINLRDRIKQAESLQNEDTVLKLERELHEEEDAAHTPYAGNPSKPEKEAPSAGVSAERVRELKEKLREFKNIRANLSILENGLSIKDRKEIEDILREGSDYKGSNQNISNYIEAFNKYEKQRAEYVGNKAVHRLANERKRLAEEMAGAHEGSGAFEKIKKGYRWLGDQNAEKLLAYYGKEPKGKLTKMITRMASLRTLAGLGLLGGGVAIGFGSAVGIAAIAARRVMGGAGVAFGSYDLMNSANERKTTALNEEKLKTMSMFNLEETMASFEAQAKYSGERVVRSKEYSALKSEYLIRLREQKNNDMTERLQFIDNYLREKQFESAKKEKNRKIIAVGLGVVSAVGFGALGRVGTEAVEQSDTAEQFGQSLEIDEGDFGMSGISPEDIERGLRDAPMCMGDQLVENEDIIASVTTEVIEQVEAEKIVGTVKKGGSAWQAAKSLVANKKISNEQFASAWSSAESTVELPSGKTIHISELGLTHVGDQVVYVAEEGGKGAHFEVVDYAEDKFHIGNNQDLADAFKAEGKSSPEWLREALGESSDQTTEVFAETETLASRPTSIGEKVVETASENFSKSEALANNETAFEAAMREGFTLSETPIDMAWGSTEFAYDSSGRIIGTSMIEGVDINRSELVEKATLAYLKPNFIKIIEDGLDDNAVEHFVMPNEIARAKEAAFELFKLNQTLDSLPDQNSAEGYYLKEQISRLTVARPIPYTNIDNKIVVDGGFINPEIFKK